MRRSSLGRIRNRAFAALVMLALLAFGGWVLQRHQSLKGSGDAEIINVAGRQRMLSQRIAFLARTLPDASADARPAARRRLLETIDLMRRSDRFLAQEGEAAKRPASQLPSPALARRIAAYLRTAEAFARTPVPNRDDPRLADITRLGTSGLLAELDRLVALDQDRAQAAGVADRRIQTALLVTTLLVLLAMAWLIVRPVLRRLLREVGIVSLLAEVASAANDATSLTDPLRETLAGVCTLTGWPIGHAYLLDEATGELVSSRVWHQELAGDFAFRAVSEAHAVVSGVGMAGLVLATGRPVSTRDFQKEYDSPRRAAAEVAGLHGGFALPLLVRDRVVGILEFFTVESATIHDDLLDVMEQLGTQLGRVIERHQAAVDLTHRAGHDGLTGLPNRALLFDRLVNAVGRSHRSAAAVGVLCVDVDRFKVLNDRLGHAAGDDLITELGRRMNGLVRDSDTVGRYGGDEFVVLCDALDDEAGVLSLAARIAASCAAPVVLEGKSHEISVSVGVAVGRGAGLRADDLIRDADLAVHRAKELGGGRIEMFDPELRAASDERTRLEAALRRAVDQQTLDLAFQPVVDIGSGALAGFEALVRWTDPELGWISPADFIPVAESTGLIHELGSFVLEQACSEAASWASPRTLQINVNLSARQVADPRIVERVQEVLASTGLDPARLGLELTETALLEESEITVATLTRLKALGVSLILDDFGTGYSSLGHLRRFPIDEVKIDRSFVMRMEEVAADRAIVQATVGLAASLGLGTVAEGVETRGQLEALRGMGCAKAQGYLLDRPLAVSEARARIGAETMVTAAAA